MIRSFCPSFWVRIYILLPQLELIFSITTHFHDSGLFIFQTRGYRPSAKKSILILLCHSRKICKITKRGYCCWKMIETIYRELRKTSRAIFTYFTLNRKRIIAVSIHVRPLKWAQDVQTDTNGPDREYKWFRKFHAESIKGRHICCVKYSVFFIRTDISRLLFSKKSTYFLWTGFQKKLSLLNLDLPRAPVLILDSSLQKN